MRKTKKRFLSLWFLSLFSLLFALTSSKIFSEGSGGQPSGKKTILDYKTEVGLNEKQAKDIEKLIGDYERRMSANLEKIKQADKELKELLMEEGNIKEIGKRVREIYRLRGEIVVDDIETGREIDKCLTKEQRDKWKEIRKSSIQDKNTKRNKEGRNE